MFTDNAISYILDRHSVPPSTWMSMRVIPEIYRRYYIQLPTTTGGGLTILSWDVNTSQDSPDND